MAFSWPYVELLTLGPVLRSLSDRCVTTTVSKCYFLFPRLAWMGSYMHTHGFPPGWARANTAAATSLVASDASSDPPPEAPALWWRQSCHLHAASFSEGPKLTRSVEASEIRCPLHILNPPTRARGVCYKGGRTATLSRPTTHKAAVADAPQIGLMAAYTQRGPTNLQGRGSQHACDTHAQTNKQTSKQHQSTTAAFTPSGQPPT